MNSIELNEGRNREIKLETYLGEPFRKQTVAVDFEQMRVLESEM